MPTLGCIGLGNMGSALMKGFAEKLDKNTWQLCGCDISKEKADAMKSLGITPMPGAKETAASSDILILAVKPQQMETLINEIQPLLRKEAIVISIAAGFRLQQARLLLGASNRLARCMPTITAQVGKGVFALCFDPLNFSEKEQQEITDLFNNIGICTLIEESRFTDFSAFIGAAPAFVYAFLHAMAQGGLTLGFSNAENYKMLLELVSGCVKLASEENKAFMELRDRVCSPAGLTIAGVNVLDRSGFTGEIVEAMEASARRGHEMEK